jgi:hypothetical protein
MTYTQSPSENLISQTYPPLQPTDGISDGLREFIAIATDRSPAIPPEPVTAPQCEPTTESPDKSPGRPPRFTPELRRQFCTYLRLGFSRATAAQLVGIGKRTVARALHDDLGFAANVRAAHADGASAAMRHINQAAPNHWRAAAWVLDQRRRKPASRITVRQLLRSREFKAAVCRVIAESSPRNQAVELIRKFLNERAGDDFRPKFDVHDLDGLPLLTADFSRVP